METTSICIGPCVRALDSVVCVWWEGYDIGGQGHLFTVWNWSSVASGGQEKSPPFFIRDEEIIYKTFWPRWVFTVQFFFSDFKFVT